MTKKKLLEKIASLQEEVRGLTDLCRKKDDLYQDLLAKTGQKKNSDKETIYDRTCPVLGAFCGEKEFCEYLTCALNAALTVLRLKNGDASGDGKRMTGYVRKERVSDVIDQYRKTHALLSISSIDAVIGGVLSCIAEMPEEDVMEDLHGRCPLADTTDGDPYTCSRGGRECWTCFYDFCPGYRANMKRTPDDHSDEDIMIRTQEKPEQTKEACE